MKVGKDGSFPPQIDLKECIAETPTSADGKAQYFDVHIATFYGKLGKTQQYNI